MSGPEERTTVIACLPGKHVYIPVEWSYQYGNKQIEFEDQFVRTGRRVTLLWCQACYEFVHVPWR